MILEVGVTPGVIALVLALLLGAGAVIALVAAAIAVLVLGPRRPEAMTLPAGAAFVASVGYVLLSGGRVSPTPVRDPRRVPRRVCHRLAAARLTRRPGSTCAAGGPRHPDRRLGPRVAARRSRDRARDRRGRLQSAFPLLIFPLIGVLIGLRSALVLDRNAAAGERSRGSRPRRRRHRRRVSSTSDERPAPRSRRRPRRAGLVGQVERRRRGGARARLPLLRHGPALSGGDLARAQARRPAAAGTIRPALVALVPEIALVPDANGRLAHVSVDGADVTADVHTPRVDEAVSAVSRRPGAAGRAPRAAAGARGRAGRDRHGRPRHRDGRPARRRPEDLPRRLGRGAGPAPDGGARARRRQRRGAVILAQLRRRDDLDRNRAVAPLRPADDAVHIVTDGNRFEDTVAAVVAAIRAAEARAAVGGGSRPMTDAATRADVGRPTKPAIDEEELLRGDLTPLIAAAALGARFVAARLHPRPGRGRHRRDPARGPGDPRRQPHLERRRRDHRRVADAAARAADPLARQEGDVRLAGRRLDGPQRRRSSRSTAARPTSRRSGSPSASSTRARS